MMAPFGPNAEIVSKLRSLKSFCLLKIKHLKHSILYSTWYLRKLCLVFVATVKEQYSVISVFTQSNRSGFNLEFETLFEPI